MNNHINRTQREQQSECKVREKMKFSGSFSREDVPTGVARRFRVPVLFDLPRESKKAPYSGLAEKFNIGC